MGDNNDPEVSAMGDLARILGDLPDDEARTRVLDWATRRFSKFAPRPVDRPSVSSDQVSPPPAFETFADLFDAVSPGTDKEKAVVAAYWVTKVGGSAQFQSQELNQILKDLGHGVSNITDALSAAIQEKPAMILQLKKSGTSRQARKTYKPTNQALRWVEERIGNGAAK